MKKLTNNVGDKIKRASIIVFICSLIWSCLESFLYFEKSYLDITKAGDVVMNGNRPDFIGGLVVLIVLVLISIVIFLLMYGFGDIVENIATIKDKICADNCTDNKENIENNKENIENNEATVEVEDKHNEE